MAKNVAVEGAQPLGQKLQQLQLSLAVAPHLADNEQSQRKLLRLSRQISELRELGPADHSANAPTPPAANAGGGAEEARPGPMDWNAPLAPFRRDQLSKLHVLHGAAEEPANSPFWVAEAAADRRAALSAESKASVSARESGGVKTPLTPLSVNAVAMFEHAQQESSLRLQPGSQTQDWTQAHAEAAAASARARHSGSSGHDCLIDRGPPSLPGAAPSIATA